MLLAWLCQVGANTGSDDNYVDLVSTGTRVKPVRLLPEEHPQRDAEAHIPQVIGRVLAITVE